MNVWFKDPRVEASEIDVFEADRAESRREYSAARDLYKKAAEGFAAVALQVPPDHPNTRSALAIAAVASFARAGDFGQAIVIGQRFLAQGGALNAYGRRELMRMVSDYASLMNPARSASQQRSDVGTTRRTDVREQFRRAA